MPTPPAIVTPRHRMVAQIFEHPANEIAHVDQRNFGKAVKLLCGGLGAGAGSAGDVSKTRGARDIDAAMDRVDPCRTGIRHDDSRGAENRQAADDAKTAVERLRRQFRSAGNSDLDLGICGTSGRSGDFGDSVTDHAAWNRIDRWLAWRKRQPGPRDGADAFAGAKCHASARRTNPHSRHDQGAVGYVRIVAGILDDSGTGCCLIPPRHRQCEARTLAARQRHLDRIGKFAGHQRGERGLRRRGGASAGGPAPAQRTFLPLHAPSFSPVPSNRHPASAPS